MAIDIDDLYSSASESSLRDVNVGSTERELSLVGGTLLTLYGLQRGGGSGTLLALLGGGLLYRGATGYCHLYDALGLDSNQPESRFSSAAASLRAPKPAAVHLETAITINRPIAELYRYWRRQENLPHFMTSIDAVTPISDTRSHWVAKTPLEGRLEWDSEIIADEPDQKIAWRSLEGSDIDHRGEVRFQPAPGGRGSEVRLMPLSDGLADEQVLFLSDILPTGWQAAEQCAIKPDDTVMACRKGGTVSVPGVYGGVIDKIPWGAAVNKGLAFRMGQTHVHRYLRPLLARIEQGEIDPSFIITHRLSLEEAEEGYATFKHKADECIKVAMKP